MHDDTEISPEEEARIATLRDAHQKFCRELLGDSPSPEDVAHLTNIMLVKAIGLAQVLGYPLEDMLEDVRSVWTINADEEAQESQRIDDKITSILIVSMGDQLSKVVTSILAGTSMDARVKAIASGLLGVAIGMLIEQYGDTDANMNEAAHLFREAWRKLREDRAVEDAQNAKA
jgi:hypothetical protein